MFSIDDTVFWFDGEDSGYLSVYTGTIYAIYGDDVYDVFSDKKPHFTQIKGSHLFTSREIEGKIKERRAQWAEEYIQRAKEMAQSKANNNVGIEYHTLRMLHLLM